MNKIHKDNDRIILYTCTAHYSKVKYLNLAEGTNDLPLRVWCSISLKTVTNIGLGHATFLVFPRILVLVTLWGIQTLLSDCNVIYVWFFTCLFTWILLSLCVEILVLQSPKLHRNISILAQLKTVRVDDIFLLLVSDSVHRRSTCHKEWPSLRWWLANFCARTTSPSF